MSHPGHRYMPALDGIRGCGVVCVMLHAAGSSLFPGAFLGVDTFFVLSGFLITSLLLKERAATGRIALGEFWARRARRLLPALFLVLSAVLLYMSFLAPATQLRNIRNDALATLGYVANWHFIETGRSYFASFAQPLKHMWSLAIEEQFYLFWPLLVTGLLWMFRGSLRALAIFAAAVAAVSAMLMYAMFNEVDPSRVYFGTDTRVQSVLVGALLAMLLARRSDVQRAVPRVALQAAGLLSAAVLGYWWATINDHTPWLYRGGFLIQAVLVAVVIAAVTQQRTGPLGALLSWRPLCWVGTISYGLYLWHQPVNVVLDSARTDLHGDALLLARLTVTLAIATASYYLVELPIRRGGLRGWRVRFALPTAVVTVVVGLLVVTAGAPPAQREIAASDLRAPTAVRAKPASAESRPTRVLIVGDSMADSLTPGLVRLAQGENLEIWNASVPGCGMVADTGDVWVGRWRPIETKCLPGWRDRWPEHLAQFRPDVVIALYGVHDIFDRRVGGREVRFDTPEGAELQRQDFQDATDLLTSTGAQLVWLTLPCSTDVTLGEYEVERSYQNPEWADRWNRVVLQVGAENPARVHSFDLNGYICPDGVWTDTVAGIDIRSFDTLHLSDTGADYVASWLVPQVQALPRSIENAVQPGLPALAAAASIAEGYAGG